MNADEYLEYADALASDKDSETLSQLLERDARRYSRSLRDEVSGI